MKRVFYTQYTNVPGPKPENNNDPSMTWQHCKDECDILQIVKKPNLGVNPYDVPSRKPLYGDFDSSLSFQEAQNVIIKANEQFEELPSNIRDRFRNDPVNLLKFVEDPSNYEEGVKLGIYEKVVDNSQINSQAPSVDNGEPGKAGLEPTPAPAPELSAQ